MNDLFRKLNILVKSSLNDLIGEPGTTRRRSLPPERLGREIDNEVAALRARINEAVAYEDQLQRRVAEIMDEVARLDAEADAAVEAKAEDRARYAVEQMKRAQQRLTMAENDLRDHRLVTQELIMRVNTLEAVVADARRAQANAAAAAEQQTEEPAPLPGRLLSDVLKEARERVAQLGSVIEARDEQQSAAATPQADAPNPSPQSVDDDLASRRQRLSK